MSATAVLWILVPLGVFLVSVWLTAGLRRYALRTRMLDIPNSRSSHSLPTPRGGGLAIAISFSLGLGVLWWAGHVSPAVAIAVGVCGAAIAVIGLLDDRRGMSAGVRLAVHLAAAAAALWVVGGFPQLPFLGRELGFAWLGPLVGLLFIVWLLNLYNFMDGIDGIAGVECVTVAASASALLAVGGDYAWSIQLLILAAAALGFLVWNWPPAKIFMGDVGSGYLGFVLAGFALATAMAGALSLWTWGILLAVFIVDATFTLIRRLVRGERVHQPHRSHAYQKLSRRLGGHRPVTVGVALVNVCWLLPWAIVAEQYPGWAWLCVAASWAPLLALAARVGAGAPDETSARDASATS